MLGQHRQIRVLKLILILLLLLIFMIMLCTVPPSGSLTWCSLQRHRASWLHQPTHQSKDRLSHASYACYASPQLAETGGKECNRILAHAQAHSQASCMAIELKAVEALSSNQIR